jgi:uroporphyrin-III C-methyltransferase
MTGTVYLVGAGPGAADLLTLRAARLLARADILFHDDLVHPDVLALAANASKVAVGKRCGVRSTAQRFINKRLVDAAAVHAVVVRLKGGDPMLFGRVQEEIAALESARIPFEIVPGVTAATAAAAEIATSLTQRGQVRAIAFVTPRTGAGEADSDWARAVRNADAAAIYMGAREGAGVAAALLAAGRSAATPVALVENASLPARRVHYTTLAALHELSPDAITGPALLFVGPQFAPRASHAQVDCPEPAADARSLSFATEHALTG